MFLHTFYTWIVANLLHPLIFLLARFIIENVPGTNHEIFEVAILFLVYSFCFSLPCLLLGWLTLYLILVSLYSDDAKFFLWLVTASSLGILVFLIILFLGGLLNSELLLFSFPGVAALSASILIRYKQFKKLIHLPKNETHETNLV